MIAGWSNGRKLSNKKGPPGALHARILDIIAGSTPRGAFETGLKKSLTRQLKNLGVRQRRIHDEEFSFQ